MAKQALDVCEDCGERATVMFIVEYPTEIRLGRGRVIKVKGGRMAVCSPCWQASTKKIEVAPPVVKAVKKRGKKKETEWDSGTDSLGI